MACQEPDVPVELIKSNKDLFSHFIYCNFNNSLFSSNFPSNLKAADILPIHKKKDKSDIENYCQISSILLRSLRFLNLTKFFLNINVVFAKVIIFNIFY